MWWFSFVIPAHTGGSDLSTGWLSNLNPKAKFYDVDICDPELRQVFKDKCRDVNGHHAAQGDLRHAVVEPSFDAEVNILGSIKLADNAHQFGVKKFIYKRFSYLPG